MNQEYYKRIAKQYCVLGCKCLLWWAAQLPAASSFPHPSSPLSDKLKCTARWTSKPVNTEVSCWKITFVICLHFTRSPFPLGSLKVYCPSPHSQVPLQPVDPLHMLKRKMREKPPVQIFSPCAFWSWDLWPWANDISFPSHKSPFCKMRAGLQVAVKAAWGDKCDDGIWA